MLEIKEGFRFDGIHTKEYGMSLKSRTAPSPEEKSIIEEVPFMQGVYDFSMILGERAFKNRPLTYRFETYERNYTYRKIDEIVLKNWLIKTGFQPLYDDHNKGFYYLAKCTNVNVEDDHVGGRLIIEITFDAYPFMIGKLNEGHDLWDEINFELDVLQPMKYIVTGSLSINLLNTGSRGVSPTIIVSSPMSINKSGTTYSVRQGESKSETFRLEIGENPMTIQGNGTITFKWNKELI